MRKKKRQIFAPNLFRTLEKSGRTSGRKRLSEPDSPRPDFEFTRSFCCRVFDRMREVDLGSGRALLIKQRGEFSAIGHKCPHYGAPLVKGERLIFRWRLNNPNPLCLPPLRCVVQRTRALSLARRLLQHRDRRHRGLPRPGQPAHLPGELVPRPLSYLSALLTCLSALGQS